MTKPKAEDFATYEEYNDALEIYTDWLYEDYETRYNDELYSDII